MLSMQSGEKELNSVKPDKPCERHEYMYKKFGSLMADFFVVEKLKYLKL